MNLKPGIFGRARPGRKGLGVVAILCCVLACAVVEEHVIGWNEHSHFAQIRAFDHGTAVIDPWRRSTGDRAFFAGHYYSDKAPGLALAVVPVYHLIRATSVVAPAGFGAIHLLVIVGCVVPLAVILVLAFRLVGRSEPRWAPITVVTLALGTLLLPFSTVLFSHVLAAAAGFAAFYLLWRQGQRGGGSGWVFAAGALAGYGVTTEYPQALLALVLALYLVWRDRQIRSLVPYAVGVALGLVPLLLYDWWAFGSPLRLSYSYVAANSSGVLGLGAPSLHNAVSLLLSHRGMFVVTPVAAAALAGIVLLYREGRRMDAVVPALVFGAYFFYNACYYLPFGGAVPGPRFMITVLPFLALPLATAYRRAPITTLGLGAVSAAMMIAATVTLPILSYSASTWTWWRMLTSGQFDTHGVTILLFGGLVLVAIVAALRATPPPRIFRTDILLAAVALGGWLALVRAAPLLGIHPAGGPLLALFAVLAVGVALVLVVSDVARGERLAFLALLPLLALVGRPLDRTGWAFGLAACSLVLLVLARQLARTPVRPGTAEAVVGLRRAGLGPIRSPVGSPTRTRQ